MKTYFQVENMPSDFVRPFAPDDLLNLVESTYTTTAGILALFWHIRAGTTTNIPESTLQNPAQNDIAQTRK